MMEKAVFTRGLEVVEKCKCNWCGINLHCSVAEDEE